MIDETFIVVFYLDYELHLDCCFTTKEQAKKYVELMNTKNKNKEITYDYAPIVVFKKVEETDEI